MEGKSGTGGANPNPRWGRVELVGDSGIPGVDAADGVTFVELDSTSVFAEDLFFSMLLGLCWPTFSLDDGGEDMIW